MRDSHRQRTYDAENLAFTDTSLEVRQGLRTIEKIADALARTAWWYDQRGTTPNVVEASPTATRSTASRARNQIRIAYGMDTVATICHEMAHLVAADAHGPSFRAASIELVRLAAGDESATRLADAYARARLSVADIPLALIPSSGPVALDLLVLPDVASDREVRRVARLLAKAASTTPEEAELLRTKAIQLSTRHGITRAHLEAATTDAQTTIVSRNIRLGAGPYVSARYGLLAALAGATCCETLWINDRRGRIVHLMGHASDVASVESLFSVLDHQARVELLSTPTSGNTVQFRRAWLMGFASAVGRKLRAASTPTPDTDPELVRSTDLVITERKEAVRSWVKEHHPRIRRVASGGAPRSAFSAGAAAGAKVSLATRSLPSPKRALGTGA